MGKLISTLHRVIKSWPSGCLSQRMQYCSTVQTEFECIKKALRIPARFALILTRNSWKFELCVWNEVFSNLWKIPGCWKRTEMCPQLIPVSYKLTKGKSSLWSNLSDQGVGLCNDVTRAKTDQWESSTSAWPISKQIKKWVNPWLDVLGKLRSCNSDWQGVRRFTLQCNAMQDGERSVGCAHNARIS